MAKTFKRIPVPARRETIVRSLGDEETCLPQLSRQFLLAGKAVFTVDNGRGERYTYKVRKTQLTGRDATFFVNVKSSGGRYPYRYVGILNPMMGTIKCTAKSEYVPGTREYDIAALSASVILNSKPVPVRYRMHAGKCGRCARVLDTTSAVALRGICGECYPYV